jgi:hypothetical protein
VTEEFSNPHFLPCGDGRNCVRYTLQELLLPLFNNSVIFVEYPIHEFANFSCDPLTARLMMYDDNNIPIVINTFDSKFFGKRSYD